MGLKIAITSHYLPGGSKVGVGYQVHYLANALVRRGHTVTVFSQCAEGDEALYSVVRVPTHPRSQAFGFAWNLRQYDWRGYDVLHACGDDWFLWGKRRPRHVHTFMGSCAQEALHARSFSFRLQMAILALGQLGSCFLADELAAISRDTCRFLPPVKRVIPCGVDLQVFAPGAEKSPSPSILFVGTLHSRKRGQLLLEAFARDVRPHLPQAELWAVCGETIEQDGVRWFGRVDESTLIDLYQRAWLFCLPSSYEGFGVPYIEAMATGTPVVATPNPGAREVTQNGACGVLTSEAQLGQTLRDLLNDEPRREQLREAGLQRAGDFDWDCICAQYEALYAMA